MYLHLLEDLARQHTAELRTASARQAARPARPLRALRTRTGWALVQVGLRLATPQAGPQAIGGIARPAGS